MRLTLSERIPVADDATGFWLEPEEPLDYVAGQFGDFTLADLPEPDGKGDTRAFSFACAPGGGRVLIATRIRGSAFKRALAAAPAGTAIELMGPMGDFTLHRDTKRPAAFLVGGIGITPVRGIVEHAVQSGSGHRIFVFHSNRTAASTPFLEDFRAWDRDNASLDYIPTLTDETPADWPGELGPIDRAMLERRLGDLHAPVYYVVGPPAMVAAMKTLLDGIGIDELQVRSEDFAGY